MPFEHKIKFEWKTLRWIDSTSEYLQMQHTANRRAESSGGWQSGKNGFKTYVLKVKATIACEQGRTIMHSIHNRINAMNGPKVSMM